MKFAFAIFLSLIGFFSGAWAQNTSIFPKGEESHTDNHTGTIWLNELAVPDSALNLSLAQATFGARAKLDWHTHPAGQFLLVTDGQGLYQERGKPIRVVHKGDVIKCLPGVEHWHGATPNTTFTYIGVTPAQMGKTVWGKRVTDVEYAKAPDKNSHPTNNETAILQLSKDKWQWMADKNINALNELFEDSCMFIHMGGTWGKEKELEVIKSGNIWYKKAEVYSASVKFFGNTAILLNEIDLVAVVGGKEVVNPFMVTEVCLKTNDRWRMGSLTFSRLIREVKLGK